MTKKIETVIKDWVASTFGEAEANDEVRRAAKLVEECLEHCQAVGLAEAEAKAIVESVYSRPVGDPRQELAGTLFVAASICPLYGDDVLGLIMREMARCFAKTKQSFVDNNSTKPAIDRRPAS